MIPRGQTPERKAYMKAWNAAHPGRDRKAYKKAYDLAHSEENAAYREANKQKLKAQHAESYQKNRARRLAVVKAYAEANPEKILNYHRRYSKANPEKIAVWSAASQGRRRARRAGNGGSHTGRERREKFAQLGNSCFYCGTGGRMTIDHDIPICRGGTDNIENILPACMTCNKRKGRRTSLEFLSIQRTNHTKTGGGGSPADMKGQR